MSLEGFDTHHRVPVTDLFLIKNKSHLSNELRVAAVILKGNKAESFRSARLTVDHDRGIDDFSKFGKESTHSFRRGLRC
jgi:hypothetical protein